jgi:hypothetical protein
MMFLITVVRYTAKNNIIQRCYAPVLVAYRSIAYAAFISVKIYGSRDNF